VYTITHKGTRYANKRKIGENKRKCETTCDESFRNSQKKGKGFYPETTLFLWGSSTIERS